MVEKKRETVKERETETERDRERGVREREREKKTDVPKLYAYNACEYSVFCR